MVRKIEARGVAGVCIDKGHDEEGLLPRGD